MGSSSLKAFKEQYKILGNYEVLSSCAIAPTAAAAAAARPLLLLVVRHSKGTGDKRGSKHLEWNMSLICTTLASHRSGLSFAFSSSSSQDRACLTYTILYDVLFFFWHMETEEGTVDDEGAGGRGDERGQNALSLPLFPDEWLASNHITF